MRYTPVELRHVRLGRSLFGGYKRDELDRLMEDVADSFEEVWRERGELADKLEDLERLLADVKQRESLLASTLVSAERAAVEAKEAAKREAELILAEAHQEARSVTRAAQTIVFVERPQKRKGPRDIVVGHHERHVQTVVHVIVDRAEFLHDALVRPVFERTPEKDTNQLAEHAGIDTFEVIIGKLHVIKLQM